MIDPEVKAYIDQRLWMVSRLREDRFGPNRTIYAEYTTDASQSISNNASPAEALNYEDKVKDTHNIVTVGSDWLATIPVPGAYDVEASLIFAASTAWGLGETGRLELWKNGLMFRYLDRKDNFDSSGAAQYMVLNGSKKLWFETGDTIGFHVYQNSGGALALLNAPAYCWMTICLNR